MAEQFFIPTKVIAGKGCIREHASLLAALGAKAMVVTGCHSALVNGSQADITAALQEKRIPYFVYNRIASNPSIAAVREAAAVARDEGADFVIGCGGGSPLDAAKAIALLAANDLDDAELFAGIFENPALPMVAVPTTAGTGSEVTQYAILTNDRLQTKTSIASEAIFPRLAFLDATYTLSLPLRVTVNTALDALSHALEGCLAKRAIALSNLLAAESLRISGACLPLLRGEEISWTVREQLLYASMLAGMVIAHTGTTALHAMGYSLTYFRDIDHGRANGLLMSEYLRFVAASCRERVEEALRRTGFADLDSFQAMLKELLGEREWISEAEIDRFSAIAIRAKNIGNTLRNPVQQDLAEIIRRSFI